MPRLRLLRIDRERNEVLCFDVGIGQVISGQDTVVMAMFLGVIVSFLSLLFLVFDYIASVFF